MCVSDPSWDCRGRLRHAGNRWQRRSRLEGSARLVTRLDVEVAAGPEAPAMQVTLPAAPESPLHQGGVGTSLERQICSLVLVEHENQ